MSKLDYFFKFIEITAFILPAIPDNIYVRFTILGTYAYLHVNGYQYMYATFKKKFLEKR